MSECPWEDKIHGDDRINYETVYSSDLKKLAKLKYRREVSLVLCSPWPFYSNLLVDKQNVLLDVSNFFNWTVLAIRPCFHPVSAFLHSLFHT
jgi:uncharacterized protein YdeI (YjbR/CyaY-like superfamily)